MTLDPASSRAETERFYRIADLAVGTGVVGPNGERGEIVKRGGRIWVNRHKHPLVRWNGKIDAVPVPWEEIKTL